MFEDPRDTVPAKPMPRTVFLPLTLLSVFALGALTSWLVLTVMQPRSIHGSATGAVCLDWLDQYGATGSEFVFDESWEDNGPHRFDLKLAEAGKPEKPLDLCSLSATGALAPVPRVAAP